MVTEYTSLPPFSSILMHRPHRHRSAFAAPRRPARAACTFSSAGCSESVDELVDASAGVAALLHFGQHHGMRDAHTRRKLLGNRFDELIERAPRSSSRSPRAERFLRLIFLSFFGSPAAFTSGLVILDLVLGGLGYDHALGVEARCGPRGRRSDGTHGCAGGASCVPSNLVELREYHGVDGHVDANAQACRYRK